MEMRHPVPEDAALIFQRYSSLLEVTCFLGWPRHQSLADSNAFIGGIAATRKDFKARRQRGRTLE